MLDLELELNYSIITESSLVTRESDPLAAMRLDQTTGSKNRLLKSWVGQSELLDAMEEM